MKNAGRFLFLLLVGGCGGEDPPPVVDDSGADALEVVHDAEPADQGSDAGDGLLDAPTPQDSPPSRDAGPADLGVDAAAADTGRDTGTDSGHDAGSQGPSDLGRDLGEGPDAFEPYDGGQGLPDTGPEMVRDMGQDAPDFGTDSGPPDLGPPDMGPPDEGPPDLGADLGTDAGSCTRDLLEPNDREGDAPTIRTFTMASESSLIDPTWHALTDSDWFRYDVARVTGRPVSVNASTGAFARGWVRVVYYCGGSGVITRCSGGSVPCGGAGQVSCSNRRACEAVALGSAGVNVTCADLDAPTRVLIEATPGSGEQCRYSLTTRISG